MTIKDLSFSFEHVDQRADHWRQKSDHGPEEAAAKPEWACCGLLFGPQNWQLLCDISHHIKSINEVRGNIIFVFCTTLFTGSCFSIAFV